MFLTLCTGIETRFRGQYFHSLEYKDAAAFQGKRVLVVGTGNTGCDIAVDMSRVAAKVQHHGGWDMGQAGGWLKPGLLSKPRLARPTTGTHFHFLFMVLAQPFPGIQHFSSLQPFTL